MRVRSSCAILLICWVASSGCNKSKSTDELIGDLKSGQEGERLIAARLLPQRKGDAAKVVPALIGALKDNDSDIRWSASVGLGYFGEQAKDAIPALQTAQHDRDARVREGQASPYRASIRQDLLTRISYGHRPNKRIAWRPTGRGPARLPWADRVSYQ